MPRFFVQKTELTERKAFIKDRDSIHKARQVLRMRVGDSIELFDGEGGLYSGKLEKLAREAMEVEIVSQTQAERAHSYFVLAQALPRAGKLDLIVKMCTEIGVDEFIFFASEYSVGKHSQESIKLERYQRIAIAAAAQSERLFVPRLGFASSLEQVVQLQVEKKYAFTTRSTENAEDAYQLPRFTNSWRVLYFIGPEGGFSPSEHKLFAQENVQQLYMNLPILRVETAAVAASSLLIAK